MDNSSFLDQIDTDFSDALAQSNPEGKVPAVTAVIERPLTEEDVQQYLSREGGSGQAAFEDQQRDVHVLRARHHSLARLLAAGVPEGVAAEITGYTAGHISVLKNSPAMTQLIEHYRSPGDQQAKHMAEELRLVAGMSLGRLRKAVEQDELDPNVLLALAKLGLDRSGHGPTSTVHSLSEHRVVDVTELARLSLEARRRDDELLIPVSEIRKALPHGNSSSGE
jgi:hypothetical protein